MKVENKKVYTFTVDFNLSEDQLHLFQSLNNLELMRLYLKERISIPYDLIKELRDTKM